MAYRLNHTMSDGAGIVQFLNAVAEIAGSASKPSIAPVWRKELSARDPPQITCMRREYEQVPITTAGKLCENPLVYALELVKKAKAEATVEYTQSVADLMVTKGRPCFTKAGTWIVSSASRFGFRDVDIGWGKTVYGGPATAGAGPFSRRNHQQAVMAHEVSKAAVSIATTTSDS
ncbi:benzyl alcohol O-benzoyltransferase-like [Neltuma alba]|uniref:benzyl alcohol O-benzoyltransferase-like n=1 Tax=Neltuma alba TaxID=207710 RepID=UPI0010A3BE02|nr:benzyl alcohol O-benzoyltransferase-like [Prosopis alba]